MNYDKEENGILFWDAIKFLTKHFKLLSTSFLLLFVATYLITRFVITSKYEAVAVIYPANFIPVSNESATEQAVQMLSSGDIKWKIIDSFNLIEHYGFNKTTYSQTRLNNKYDRLVKIEPTAYSSIKITVLDKDAQKAANIANAIVEQLSAKMLAVKGEKFQEWARFYKSKFENKQHRIDSLEKELTKIRKDNGILNFEEQSASLIARLSKLEDTEKNADTRIEYFKSKYFKYGKDSITKYEIAKLNATARLAEIRPRFSSLLDLGDKLGSIKSTIELELEALSEYKTQYEEAEQNAKRKISYSYNITDAVVNDEPTYPRKTITSLLVSISGFVAICLALISIERIKFLKGKME